LAAARAAIEARNDPLLVRAALANTRGFSSIIGDIDADRIEVLEAALAVASTVTDRALVRAILTTELVYDAESRDRGLAMADDAIALAGEIQDPALEARVLSFAFNGIMVPERWSELAPITRRLVEVADRSGDPTLRVSARQRLAVTYLNIGDIAAAAAAIDEGGRLLGDGAGPFAEWHLRATGCQFLAYQGRIEEAVAENDAVAAIGESVGAPDAITWQAAIAGGIGSLRDAAGVDPDGVGRVADQYPRAHTWRSAHASALASVGRLDECRALIAEHGLHDPARIPRDLFWFTSVFQRATAAVYLRDAALGERVAEALLPHHDDAVCHYTLFAPGTIERARAYAALAQGHLDDAIHHHRAEVRWASGCSPAHAVTSRVELAEVLVERGAPDDLTEARDLATSAEPDARSMGLSGWVQRADEVLNKTG
jgi:hypothetical protein